MAITHHEKLAGHVNDPSKIISKDAWVASHDVDPIVNADVSATAGIVESKLALNFPTHSNANDPNTDQKAALVGTSGTASGTNRYITEVEKAAASGLATLDVSSKVVQEPASKAQASGIASLDASSKVVQEPASKAQASGIASLDSSSKVVQNPASASATPGANAIIMTDASSNVTLASEIYMPNQKSIAMKDSGGTLRAVLIYDASNVVSVGDVLRANTGVLQMTGSAENFLQAKSQGGTTYPINLAWTDYSSTSTVTGWSSFTIKLIRYCIIGKTVFVRFHIAGTSNTTGVSFTLPSNVHGTGNQDQMSVRGIDNTNYVAALADITPATNSVAIYTSAGGAGWIASGTKTVQGVLTFEIA